MKLVHVIKQGDPVISSSRKYLDHDDICIVEIDMATKRHDIIRSESDDQAKMYIYTTEDTPLIGKTSNYTEITFPAMRGWHIYLAEAVRYTIRIVFVKAYP